MKLNLNFDGFTKLRDWWKTVLDNFKIIEAECNKTRRIADNACTKEEAKAYINEFIGLSDEYMAAIEAFTDLYKENENSVAAMEEVFGERLKYYSKDTLFDANEATGEDAIFFCKSETENTPSRQPGILISKTDNKQMWIEESGEIYYRQLVDDVWSEWVSELNKWQNNLTENVGKTLEQNVEYVDNLVDGLVYYLNNVSPITYQRDSNGKYISINRNIGNVQYSRNHISTYPNTIEDTVTITGEYFEFTKIPYVTTQTYTTSLSCLVSGSGIYNSNDEKFTIQNIRVYLMDVEDNIINESLFGGSYATGIDEINLTYELSIDWANLPDGKYKFVITYDYIHSQTGTSDFQGTRRLEIAANVSHTYRPRDIIQYPSV